MLPTALSFAVPAAGGEASGAGKGAAAMDVHRERVGFSRRAFLRAMRAIGGTAVAGGLLPACGRSGPTVGDRQAVRLLWSDVTHAYAPVLEDFTQATGIEVEQSIMPYNQRLIKSTPQCWAAPTSTSCRWIRYGQPSSRRPSGWMM